MEKGEYAKAYQLEEKNWWYAARRSLVLGLLEKYSCVKNPLVLDLGCGCGKTIEALRRAGAKCTGVDFSSEAISFCGQRSINAKKMDVLDIIFEDRFDVVIALDLLEHVENDQLLAEKMFKALKPEGVLLVSVPAFNFLWSHHDTICHHKRRYRRKQLCCLLKKAGFEEKFSSYWNFSFFSPSAALKIGKRILLKKSSKSDLFNAPAPINSAMNFILGLENALITTGISMPFGTSVFCVAKKLF